MFDIVKNVSILINGNNKYKSPVYFQEYLHEPHFVPVDERLRLSDHPDCTSCYTGFNSSREISTASASNSDQSR
jgi:hypothetical protein